MISLITDLPLKTVANLNNYVIKNIISQEGEDFVDAKLNEGSSMTHTELLNDGNSNAHIVIARNNNLYASPTDMNHMKAANKCEKCQNKNKSYIDSLKYDLFKRIEYEVNKGID